MKKILLTILALLLLGTVAEAKTVRRYLRPTDTNFTEYFPWEAEESRRTVNGMTVNLAANDGGGNTANGWDFTSNKIIGNYTKLVVNITDRNNTDNIDVKLGEDGYWSGSKQYTITLSSGQTKAEFNLENLLTQTGVASGADCTGDAANINMVCVVTESKNEAMSYTFGEVYLEKEVDDSYKDFTTEPFNIDNLTLSEGITLDKETQTIAYSASSWSNSASWFYTPAQDWSGYHYFVMVPQKRWNSDEFPDRIKINTLYNNGSTDTEADIDCWYQTWAQRANIVDIEDKLPEPKYNVTRLSIFSPDNAGIFQYSAFFLTNTRPTTDGDYVRTIATDDTWGTLCLPYNYALCGAVAYEVVGVDNAEAPSTLYLQSKYGVLEAGKSYLFKTNSTDGLRAYRAGEEELGSPVSGNLQGTFSGATVPNDGTSYILKGGKWKKVDGTTNTVGANRAYLTLTTSLEVPPTEARKYIAFNLDGGESTAIKSVNDSRVKVDGYYTMSGQRVDNPAKGIYIKNGKKVVIK